MVGDANKSWFFFYFSFCFSLSRGSRLSLYVNHPLLLGVFGSLFRDLLGEGLGVPAFFFKREREG